MRAECLKKFIPSFDPSFSTFLIQMAIKFDFFPFLILKLSRFLEYSGNNFLARDRRPRRRHFSLRKSRF